MDFVAAGKIVAAQLFDRRSPCALFSKCSFVDTLGQLSHDHMDIADFQNNSNLVLD